MTTRDSENRTLFTHIWISVRRVGLGFLLALSIVLPLGILMGAFGSVRALFDPVMTASGYIPIATLVPLTMSWFGLDEDPEGRFPGHGVRHFPRADGHQRRLIPFPTSICGPRTRWARRAGR